MIVLPGPPGQRKMGVLAPMEGNGWIVTRAGWLKNYPPADGDGFLEHARSLPVPDLYEAIRHAEPLGPVATHRFPSNLRRRYERMSRFPEGLVVVGDAQCSFNPVYGQGMTTAALGVDALDGCLRRQRGAVPSRMFRERIAATADAPWDMVTTEDLRYPEVQGPRPVGRALMSWYAARVAEISGWDPLVFARFAQ